MRRLADSLNQPPQRETLNLPAKGTRNIEMIFTQKKTTTRAVAKPARKLYSVHTLLRQRAFVGEIESGQAQYGFTFAPHDAAIVNRKLELTGTVTVQTPQGKTNSIEHVNATLAGIQGAMGSATRPREFQLITASPFPNELNDDKPLTEYTNGRSAIGVVYLQLSPLDGKKLGLPFDMSKVQLNGRLAVLDQPARDLQWLLTQAHAALAGEKPDAQLAEPYVTEMSRVLKG